MDNFKAIYKILKELEKHMGDDNFSLSCISAEKLKLPYGRWEQILILMQDDGYIKGLVVDRTTESPLRHIVEPVFPQITIKGLESCGKQSYGKSKRSIKNGGRNHQLIFG